MEQRVRTSNVVELQGSGMVRNASGCLLGNRQFHIPAQLTGSTEAAVNDEVFIPGQLAAVAEHETSALKEILPEQIKQLDHLRSQLLIPHYMGDVSMLLHTHETFKRQNSAFFWKEVFLMLCSTLTILISMIFLVQYVQKISMLDPNIHNSYTS